MIKSNRILQKKKGISHVSGTKNSILMVTKPTPKSTPTQHNIAHTSERCRGTILSTLSVLYYIKLNLFFTLAA